MWQLDSQFLKGCKVFNLNNRRIKGQQLARVSADRVCLPKSFFFIFKIAYLKICIGIKKKLKESYIVNTSKERRHSNSALVKLPHAKIFTHVFSGQ